MKRIVLILTITMQLFFLTACNQWFRSYIPGGGTWECDTLHIVVNFSEKQRCNATVADGEATIQCLVGYHNGSNVISIICQDRTTERYSMGEEVYCLKCIRLTSDSLTVIDRGTGEEHVFIPIQSE